MPPLNIDALSYVDLKSFTLELLEKLAELERTVAALRDEIARLKGGPGRPNIKPNSKPSDDERSRIAAAGLELAAYFRGQNWKPKGSTIDVPEGPNAIVLFAGVDPRSAAVELSVSGVGVQTDGRTGPAPSGTALLRISYSADILHPDVLKIPPGRF